ncbi:MAG: hypothetical protein WKG06_20775 [Segetibacter sp.]
MKKLFVPGLIVMIIVAGSLSCKKIIKKIFEGIDADVPVISVTLPAIPIALPIEVPFPPITQYFNLDSTVKANTGGAFGANDVSSIKIKQIVFDLSNADSLNNISNFESVRVTFFSNAITNPVQIASITFPDTYAAMYTYTPENSPELRPYLNGSQLTYNVYGKIRRMTTKELGLSINVTLRVQ